MRSLLFVLSVGVASSSAWAEQPVTAADLIGSTMDASVTNDRMVRREGRDYPDRYRQDWNIVFVSEGTIRVTMAGTAYTPRGTRKAPSQGARVITLERPEETKSRGGGHGVWLFDAGALTFLRTFQGGGMKATFAVTRNATGFQCAANMTWPREVGVPTIVMRSFVDNARFEILSAKQASSSCKVSTPASAATPGQRS